MIQKYKDLDEKDLPSAECLKDTLERFLSLLHKNIVPVLKRRKRNVISAHGNSLRALVKYIDSIPAK